LLMVPVGGGPSGLPAASRVAEPRLIPPVPGGEGGPSGRAKESAANEPPLICPVPGGEGGPAGLAARRIARMKESIRIGASPINYFPKILNNIIE